MALIFTEGFDHYTGASNSSVWFVKLDLSDRYTVDTNYISGAANLTFTNGMYGGFCLSSGTAIAANNSITYTFPSALTSICFGVHHLSTSGTGCVVRLSNAAGSYIQLRLVSYLPTVITSAGSYAADPSFTVTSNWNYYEIKVDVTGSTANIQVWVDDQQILNLSGITWYSSGNQTIEQFTLGKVTGDTIAVVSSQYYDDVYVTTSERLGPIEIQTIKPSADVTKQWATSTTNVNNYPLVSEDTVYATGTTGRPSMDDYVQATVRNQTDEYELQDIQSKYDDYDILAVTPLIFSNQTATSPMQVTISDGNNVYSGLPLYTPPTSSTIGYLKKFDPIQLNPFTSAAWSATDINSLRLGYIFDPIPDVPSDPFWDDVIVLAYFDDVVSKPGSLGTYIVTHDATQKSRSNYGQISTLLIDATNAQSGFGKVVRNTSANSGNFCNILPNDITTTIDDWTYEDEFTVEFWFRPTSYIPAGRGLLGVKTTATTYDPSTIQWMISDYNDARGLTLEISIAGTLQALSLVDRASVQLPVNTWHYVAFSRDSSGIVRWFINGQMVAKSTPWLGTCTAVGYLRLFNRNGIDGDTTNSYTVGAFDDIRITKKCRYSTDDPISVPTLPFPRPL